MIRPPRYRQTAAGCCAVGFDPVMGAWLPSTGLAVDGSRTPVIEDTVAEGRRSRIVAGGPIGARPRRRARLVGFGAAVTVGLALALAACGDGGGSSGVDVAAAKNPTVETTSPKSDLPEVAESKYTDETGKATVEVAAVDNAFEPRYTKVSKDTDVVFINKGAVPHNVVPATKGQFVEISAAALASRRPGDAEVHRGRDLSVLLLVARHRSARHERQDHRHRVALS